MALREEILEVLNKVVENGSIPNGFAQFLERRRRAYKPEGGEETRAYPVYFGPPQNKRWHLFWECPENEARTLCNGNYPGLRFDINNPFDIPSLSNGQQVKYYLNTNIGYGDAIVSLREGMLEYGRSVGQQILDAGIQGRWMPNQGAYGNTNKVIDPVQRKIQGEAAKVPPPPQKPGNNTLVGMGDMLELRNLIIFGAPGTGKSYGLNKRACRHQDNKDGPYVSGMFEDAEGTVCRYERVTFYPNYSYAQFVGTYKPVMKPIIDDNGQPIINAQGTPKEEIAYEFVPGPFLRVLVKALNEVPDAEGKKKDWCLVIEEINRANAAAVFGDVFQLLDRKDGVSEYAIAASEDVKKFLMSGEAKGGLSEVGKAKIQELVGSIDQLIIPDNMYIWATMNSADQGVFPMETAFKRRWAFEYIGIDDAAQGECLNWMVEGNGYKWNDLRRYVNGLLAEHDVNEDKLMGPYFVKADGNNVISRKAFASKVLMYLWEDAGRMIRRNLFGNQIKTYSQLVSAWEDDGVKVFSQCVKKENLSQPLKDLYTRWTTPSAEQNA